jgi:hypothetical protein
MINIIQVKIYNNKISFLKLYSNIIYVAVVVAVVV